MGDNATRHHIKTPRKRPMILKSSGTQNLSNMSEADIAKLVSALRMYQVELEMQIDEFCRVQEELTVSRDRFSELYNSSPVGYVTLDRDAKVVDANHTLARMLGVPNQALENQSITAFIEPDDQDIFYLHQLNIQKLKQPATCEFRMLRKNGQRFWVQMDSMLTNTEGKNDSHLRTSISNIDDRKKAELDRSRLLHQLQETKKNQTLGVLAGGVAHNFNNLLCGIIGDVDIALETLPPNAPAHDNIARTLKTALRAAELSKKMLDYSGGGSFRTTSLNLHQLSRKLTDQTKEMIPKRISLETDIADDLPAFDADSKQLYRAITNLITNAIEAIGEDIGTITVSAKKRSCDRAFLDRFSGTLVTPTGIAPSEGVYLCITVSDTGCGMNEEIIEKIFDPFFSTKFTGRGLGLASVFGIVGGHKGIIQVGSVVGEGTDITMMFPTNHTTALVRSQRVFSDDIQQQTGSVLVVSGEDVVRTTAEILLRKAGYNVVTLKNCQEATRLVREGVAIFDAMIYDPGMGHAKDLSSHNELVEIQKHLPVILSSDYPEEVARSLFPKGEIVGYLQKPFDYRDVVPRVRQAVQGIIKN